MWADYVNKRIVNRFYTLLMKQSQAERDAAAASMLEGIKEFSAAVKGPYFLGESFSLVDIALAPWLAARAHVLKEYRAFQVPNTPEYAKFHGWVDAVMARPSVVATLADKAKLIASYQRYADGVAKSQVGDAVRGGTAMP
jgi:glutathione S-transferase